MSRLGIVKAIFASALTAPSVATEEHTRGYVTCLACTLEECPLVSYVFDSGLLFREQVCGACIRGYAARPPVIIEVSPSGTWSVRTVSTASLQISDEPDLFALALNLYGILNSHTVCKDPFGGLGTYGLFLQRHPKFRKNQQKYRRIFR